MEDLNTHIKNLAVADWILTAWKDPFTYPKGQERKPDDPQFKNFPRWPYGYPQLGSVALRGPLNKNDKNKSTK